MISLLAAASVGFYQPYKPIHVTPRVHVTRIRRIPQIIPNGSFDTAFCIPHQFATTCESRLDRTVDFFVDFKRQPRGFSNRGQFGSFGRRNSFGLGGFRF